MKAWWPFFLAAAVTGTLVALYLLGWYRSAWVLAIFLICFPVLYVVFAISWFEREKRCGGKAAGTACSSDPLEE